MAGHVILVVVVKDAVATRNRMLDKFFSKVTLGQLLEMQTILPCRLPRSEPSRKLIMDGTVLWTDVARHAVTWSKRRHPS